MLLAVVRIGYTPFPQFPSRLGFLRGTPKQLLRIRPHNIADAGVGFDHSATFSQALGLPWRLASAASCYVEALG